MFSESVGLARERQVQAGLRTQGGAGPKAPRGGGSGRLWPLAEVVHCWRRRWRSRRRDARVRLYTHAACAGHDPGHGHRERPERLAAIAAAVDAAGLAARLRVCAPRPAPRAALERVHAASYVEMILGLRGRRRRLDADTVVGPGSVEAALHAAGAALDASAAVLAGDRPLGAVRGAAAGAPRGARPRDGVLPVQQRRRGRRRGAGGTVAAGAGVRPGRASRQRHPAPVSTARRRSITSPSTSTRSTPAPAPPASAGRDRVPATRSTCRCRPGRGMTSTSPPPSARCCRRCARSRHSW